MPACSVEHQRDPLGEVGADIPREGGKYLAEDCRVERGKQPSFRLTGGRTNEAAEVEPVVALLDGSDRPLPDRCPDPTDRRQQRDTMLVGGPECDLSLGMHRLDGGLIDSVFGRAEKPHLSRFSHPLTVVSPNSHR
jgi:hypothetical protein